MIWNDCTIKLLFTLFLLLFAQGAFADELGEPVTIQIEATVIDMIDVEEFCAQPDAPPECTPPERPAGDNQ